MAEKEFPLLSRPAETSKVDGASGCEQVWHISLTPSTQEMPIKMRRQKQSCARHARNAGESVPNGANAPLTGIYGRDFFCSLPFLRNKHAFSRHFKLL
ncbi:hypothetical protein ADH72_03205 [Akkermansia muciniphila]|nr:hypothetical protein A4V05_07485 [Akkermansia muciniphila]ASB34772.1 hypothetical protein ADH72_03205 [Akkermansia muciniphila]